MTQEAQVNDHHNKPGQPGKNSKIGDQIECRKAMQLSAGIPLTMSHEAA